MLMVGAERPMAEGHYNTFFDYFSSHKLTVRNRPTFCP